MDTITEILQKGILAKKQGDYKLALDYYEEAKEISPIDDRIFGNIFRIQIGLEQYEEAIRNLLIICSFNRIDRLVETELHNPTTKSILVEIKKRFKSSSTLYIQGLFNIIKFEPNLISTALEKDFLLNDLILRADNLTYYIGHSLVGLTPSIKSTHNIPKKGFRNLNNALLGKPTGNDLRDHKSSGLVLCIGFMFAHMNIKNSLKTKEEVVSYFSDKTTELNYDITSYRSYLDKHSESVNKNKVNLDNNFDCFPVNLCEMDGSITRQSFTFDYQKVDVWQSGKCIFSDNCEGTIIAQIDGNLLNVTVDDDRINPYIKKNFSFREISTNLNRIIWSKDLFNRNNKTEKFNPDVSSLFYKNGILVKVAYTIYDPEIVVEFY